MTTSIQENSVFEVLETLHSDSYGWALACCSWEASIAEDVLQEAYLRTLDGRARFSGQSNPKTWFFAVIKNVANDLYRTQKRHAVLNLKVISGEQKDLDEDTCLSVTPPESIETQESVEQLQSALKMLPQRQKEVLHLVFYADLTLEETSQTLGINIGSVRTHYHRGKTRLAELLELNNDETNATGAET